MDIFEKCYAPSLAKELKEAGVYPYFHALQSRQDVEVQMEGKRRIMLGSNNYLGLTIAPDVVEAGIHALERYGTGCSGSRFLNGTLEMHLELEAKLGKFLRKPGIVTFGTGYQSNVGIISALVDRLPDMSRLMPDMVKKKLAAADPMSLVQETCVAECVHCWLVVLSVGMLFLWKSVWSWALWLVYNLLGNVSFILIQRYNRPRLLRLAEKENKKRL